VCETVVITTDQPPGETKYRTRGNANTPNALNSNSNARKKNNPKKTPSQAKWPGTKKQDEKAKTKETKSRPNPDLVE
jgi:hypothetical protein